MDLVLVCSSHPHYTFVSDRAETTIWPSGLWGVKAVLKHPGCALWRVLVFILGYSFLCVPAEHGTYVTHNQRLSYIPNTDSVFFSQQFTSSLGHRWSAVLLLFFAHSQVGAESMLIVWLSLLKLCIWNWTPNSLIPVERQPWGYWGIAWKAMGTGVERKVFFIGKAMSVLI